MSLWLAIGSVIEFCGLQWFGLRVLIDFLLRTFRRRWGKLYVAFLMAFLIGPQGLATPKNDAVKQAEQLFQTKNFDAAFVKFSEIQTDPYLAPADLALSRCRLGIIYSIRDNQKQARTSLELALSSNTLDSGTSALCFYALLQIYVMEKAYTDARTLLQKNADLVFPGQYKARVYALGVEVARQLKDSEFEAGQLTRLLKTMENAGLDAVELKLLGSWKITKADVKKRLAEEVSVAKSVSTPPPSEDTKVTATPTPVAIEAVTHTVSSNTVDSATSEKDIFSPLRSFRAGQFDKAISEILDVGQMTSLQKKIAANMQINRIRERAETLLKDDPRHVRVGVILPSGSGMYSRLQLRALKGISAFLNSRANKGVDYQVFVKTVANDSGASERAALDLVLGEKVHVLIGPFYGAQVAGVVVTANFFGVPVFVLGPVSNAREYESPFLVRMGTLSQSQARAHAQLLKQQNRKQIAILAPTDGYGIEMSRSFEAVCKSEGLQIQRVEFVDESTDVFQESVKTLLGPQDGKNRTAEYWQLVAEAKKKAAQEKRKFDPSTVKAPAYIPFQAIFVPDSLDRVRLIANTFAFFDARGIRFLGDRTWQEAGGKQSVADQFLKGARVPVPKPGAFLPYLRRELSAGDGIIDIERQSFDSLLLIRTAQYKAGGNNPARLNAATRTKEFSADGTSKFGPVDATGEPQVQFELAQFHNGIVLSPNSSLENLNDDDQVQN